MPASKGRQRVDARYPIIMQLAALATDECIIAPNEPTPDGYVQMRVPGGRRVKVHSYICALYHGPRPSGLEAAHRCGNRACMNPRHLRWATRSENQLDRRLHGTDPRGEQHPKAKLTQAQVAAIRAEYATGTTTHRALGVKYGVEHRTIGRIVKGERWQ